MSHSMPRPSVSPAAAWRQPKGDTNGRRKWTIRLLLAVGCGLLAALWFAPSLIALTALRQVPKWLLPHYPGTIEIQSASLGWLSPVVLRDVQAKDAEGGPLLEIREFSTSQPLWKLVTARSDLGRLKIVEPNLAVSFRTGGSNLEDVVQKLLLHPAKAAVPDFELEVLRASLSFEHKTASLRSKIEPASLIVTCKRRAVTNVELTIGQTPAPGQASLPESTDWLAFRIGDQPTQDDVAMTPGSKHLRLRAQGWKMDRLLPALARFEPGAELSGELDADARSQIAPINGTADWTQVDWSWDGKITLSNLTLAGLAALKQDRVVSKTVSVAGRAAAQQGRLSMDRVHLQTDFGELTATGDLPLAGLAGPSATSAASSILADLDYRFEGHLDLPRLAELLPKTIRMRDGSRITAGRLSIDLKSEGKDQGSRSWTALASVDGLAGVNNEQAVAWNGPLRLAMQAHRDQKVVRVDQVTIQSDFLQVAGSGTQTDASFTATGDLGRLESSLLRLVDVGLQKLSGQIKANGRIRRMQESQIALDSVVQLDDFHANVSEDNVWQEPHLVLSIKAAGQLGENSELKQVDSAQLTLTSGGDSLATTLQQGVDLRASSATWPVKATLAGDLRTWQNRLKRFRASTDLQLGGQATIDAAFNANSRLIELTNLTADVTSLTASNRDWSINEPKLELKTAGTWSADKREWSSQHATLTGTSASCRVDDLLIALKPGRVVDHLTGDLAFRIDLDKVSRWKNQATYYLSGILDGRTHLTEQDSVISMDAEATVAKLLIADLEKQPNRTLKWVTLLREPEVRLAAKGNYDTQADELAMERATFHTDAISLNLNGQMQQVCSAQRIDLKGELNYDWDLLGERMGDSLKSHVQFKGKNTRPISLKGSVASLTGGSRSGTAAAVQMSDLDGQAGFGWKSGIVEDLPVGAADISASLQKGVCQFSPIEATVGDGRLHFTPQVRLDRTPAVLVLPSEKVLDQIQLSTQLCATWIKYVAPLVADAAQVDGTLSLEIAEGSLPLSDPRSGEMSGILTIHQAQVRPGGLAIQVMGIVGQIQSTIQRRPLINLNRDLVLMKMPEQPVDFKLARGRVSNQGVTFLVGDATVKSSGSVGIFDETLDLELQIPIRDEWVSDKVLLPGLKALKGQTIKIPVRGTLSLPLIDGRVIAELAAKIGGAAVDGVIDNAIDTLFKKKLNKLLPGQN